MNKRSISTGSAGLMLLSALLTACGSTAMPTTPDTAATGAISAASPAATAAAATTSPTLLPTVPTLQPTVMPTDAPPAATMAATTAAHDHAPAATTTAADMNTPAGAETQAEIKLFMYKPATLDVKTGTTVIWTNQDAIEHSVTAGTPGTPSNAFDSDFFVQGESFSFTFTQPGTYDYFCKRHESMTGKLNVVAP
jgi:plastocyanin